MIITQYRIEKADPVPNMSIQLWQIEELLGDKWRVCGVFYSKKEAISTLKRSLKCCLKHSLRELKVNNKRVKL
jgi:hypothetical protein